MPVADRRHWRVHPPRRNMEVYGFASALRAHRLATGPELHFLEAGEVYCGFVALSRSMPWQWRSS